MNTDVPIRILIVADDPIVCESLTDILRKQEYDTASALSAAEALDTLADAEAGDPQRPARPFTVVITDINLAGSGNTDFLEQLKSKHPDLVILVLTAYGTIESAVHAIKLGAFEYLTHPIVEEELVLIVEKAARQGVLLAHNHALRDRLDDRYGLDNIVGHDPRMLRTYELVEAVAPTKTTVLMTGESGTGKSLIARAIHQRSAVVNGPFVELSCGSIPDTLLESELFGHVKGAFTGAYADKVGRFLAANGGTIFLDEINSASPGMQLKLLRVLQERRFEPVGSNQTVEVEVRVVLATNQALEDLVAEGRFRQDLYYRINVVRIELPALRDRVGDIPLLAEHFLEHYCREMERRIAGFTPKAMAALQRYPFPGNVRELENIVQRAVVLAQRPMIDHGDLPPAVADNRPLMSVAGTAGPDTDDLGQAWSGQSLAECMEQYERRVIVSALNANDWNRQRTSKQLRINRTTLYKKIKQYGLDRLPLAG